MAQQSIVGSNTGLETSPAATWRPSISVVYPMFNEEENIERAVHFAEDVLTKLQTITRSSSSMMPAPTDPRKSLRR